jgi:hypothetical protein
VSFHVLSNSHNPTPYTLSLLHSINISYVSFNGRTFIFGVLLTDGEAALHFALLTPLWLRQRLVFSKVIPYNSLHAQPLHFGQTRYIFRRYLVYVFLRSANLDLHKLHLKFHFVQYLITSCTSFCKALHGPVQWFRFTGTRYSSRKSQQINHVLVRVANDEHDLMKQR